MYLFLVTKHIPTDVIKYLLMHWGGEYAAEPFLVICIGLSALQAPPETLSLTSLSLLYEKGHDVSATASNTVTSRAMPLPRKPPHCPSLQGWSGSAP